MNAAALHHVLKTSNDPVLLKYALSLGGNTVALTANERARVSTHVRPPTKKKTTSRKRRKSSNGENRRINTYKKNDIINNLDMHGLFAHA
jgi:hypothetical protein